MTTRLVLCFDGTWNKPDEKHRPEEQVETNVRRFFEAGSIAAPDGTRQNKWYSEGVGTAWDERLRGGAFGYGIDEVIRKEYEFLVNGYVDADEIFVIGFSRGAYAARSLVGMLRKAGLVRDVDSVGDAYELYRQRDAAPDSPQATAFRAKNSRDVTVKFIGVWDTVGALGIPGPAFATFNKVEYGFHDTGLSRIVQNAFHAVAVDECRKDYHATLWTPPFHDGHTIEQRWFSGAHCDVGGGYKERELSDVALSWMMDKAAACGLALESSHRPAVGAGNALGTLHDSYDNFLFGLYALFKGRYLRPLTLGLENRQVLNDSVRERMARDRAYRPKNPGLPAP